MHYNILLNALSPKKDKPHHWWFPAGYAIISPEKLCIKVNGCHIFWQEQWHTEVHWCKPRILHMHREPEDMEQLKQRWKCYSNLSHSGKDIFKPDTSNKTHKTGQHNFVWIKRQHYFLVIPKSVFTFLVNTLPGAGLSSKDTASAPARSSTWFMPSWIARAWRWADNLAQGSGLPTSVHNMQR